MSRIKKQAKEEGQKVTKTGSRIGGIDVFVHPRGIKIDEENAEHRDRYFTAWFMELTSNCVC